MISHDPSRIALANYALRGAHNEVKGWLSESGISLILALAEWQRQHDVRGHVAEIGVHHGRLFCLLKNLCREDETAIAIDVFEDQHLNVDKSGEGNRTAFERNVAAYTDGRNVSVIQGDSMLLNAGQFPGPIRLFSVDGSHTAAHTEHDLTVAAHCLAIEGAIILDDFFNADWPGVQEGFHHFMHRYGHAFQLVAYDYQKAIICRAAIAPDLRRFFESLQPYSIGFKQTESWGKPVVRITMPPPSQVFSENATLALGLISLKGPGNTSARLVGFETPRPNGAWTVEPSAHVIFGPRFNAASEIRVDALPFIHPKRLTRSFSLSLNEEPLGDFVLDGERHTVVKARIPSGALAEENTLTLTIEAPESPAEFKGTTDTQTLGIHVTQVSFY